ncbi:HAD-like domain-containing protein [Gongronella butleri]|nr:HAD-like domain-containing protein [Gongronella butleri]
MSFDECTHEILFGGLCSQCGLNMEFSEQQLRQVNINVDQPKLTASRSRAGRMEQENITRLLNERKLILVLDLDQTLIHTSSSLETSNWLNDKDIADQEIFKDIRQFVLPNAPTVYHLKLRPGVAEFLSSLSSLYELHVYTMGTRDYAKAVVKELDPTGELFRDRIMAREDNEMLANARSSSAYIKSLDRLLTNNKSMVTVVDDRLDVWEYSPNLVHVRPYVFYKGVGDINSPFHLAKQHLAARQATPAANSKAETQEDEKKKADEKEKELEMELELELEMEKEKALEEERESGKPFTVDDDRELYDKLYVLQQVHAGYFESYDQLQAQKATSNRGAIKIPNIVNYIHPFRTRLFADMVMTFSGFNRNLSPRHYPEWNIANYFGAKCEMRLSPETTHFITPNVESVEAFEAKKQYPHVRVVHPGWIHFCVSKGTAQDQARLDDNKDDDNKSIMDIDVANPESTDLDFDDEFEKEMDLALDDVDWDDADREVDEAISDDEDDDDDDDDDLSDIDIDLDSLSGDSDSHDASSENSTNHAS